MADPPGSDVVHVAGAVADGLDIDWDAAVEGAPVGQRRLFEQLRLLSSISRASGPPPGIDSVSATRHWGPFDIIEELDGGSYGRIYRARDTRVERDVAVKLLPGGSDAEVQALLEEARALARVRHPNVLTVHGADRFDGVAGLWTEFIEGHTLEYAVGTWGTAGPREAVGLAADVCAALSAVHAAGLVHRDVTARNVMREFGGRTVLLDFGGVRATDNAADTIAGTPLYLAPELFAGAPATRKSDIYALGVLIYLVLTGSFPVVGQTAAEIREAHRTGKRRLARDARPDLPPRLCRVIDRALAPDPQDRFASAGELQRELLAVYDLGSAPQAAPPVAWYRRGVPLWAVVVILLVAVAATLTWRPKPADGAGEMPVPLSPELWSVLDSYHDLAETAASRGNWADAQAGYTRAADRLTAAAGEWSAPAWLEKARAAQAGRRAGLLDAEGVEFAYTRALYTLAERAGAKQPMRSAIEAARATSFWEAGRLREASHALIRAIAIRERVLRSQEAAGDRLPVLGFDPATLESRLAEYAPTTDVDGDWIPDVVELATGLDPTKPDSDGDGVLDEEEDTDGDGIANGLEWSLAGDLANTYGFEGTGDPGLVLARWFGPATSTARPSINRLWRVSGPLLSYYTWRLSHAKQAEALTRGWRLLLRARPQRGFAFAGVDFLPNGRAFALCLMNGADGGVTAILPDRINLDEARRFEFPAAKADAVFELTYDPATRSATFRVDGQRVATGYTGLTELQHGEGLAFGTGNNLGAAPFGEAEFQLVLLQIR